MDFPTPFSIKAVGEDQGDFENLVFALVEQHVPGLERGGLSSRSSSQGRYLSVTVRFEAYSRVQLEAIYQTLTEHERVLWVI